MRVALNIDLYVIRRFDCGEWNKDACALGFGSGNAQKGLHVNGNCCFTSRHPGLQVSGDAVLPSCINDFMARHALEQTPGSGFRLRRHCRRAGQCAQGAETSPLGDRLLRFPSLDRDRLSQEGVWKGQEELSVASASFLSLDSPIFVVYLLCKL